MPAIWRQSEPRKETACFTQLHYSLVVTAEPGAILCIYSRMGRSFDLFAFYLASENSRLNLLFLYTFKHSLS